MFDGDLITISNLWIVAAHDPESIYNLSGIAVTYSMYDTPRGRCRATFIGRGLENDRISTGLLSEDIDQLCRTFSPGTAVSVMCTTTDENGSSDKNITLFSGYISSILDSLTNGAGQFQYEFSADIVTPEALIPTNPTHLTHRISEDTSTLSLVSDWRLEEVLSKDNADGSQRGYGPEISEAIAALNNTNELNIAKLAALVIDKSKIKTTKTSATDLPSTMSELFDADSAPITRCPAGGAKSVAKSVVEMVTELQVNGRKSDWEAFVAVLRAFYQNPVPYIAEDIDQSQPGNTALLSIKQHMPWSPTYRRSIEPKEFIGFRNLHITALNGVYRAVAVAYPKGKGVIPGNELNNYYLCAMGYDADGNPKWVEGEINEVSSTGYQLDGVNINNILKMFLPNWLYSAVVESDKGGGSANYVDTWKQWAKNLAVTSVLSTIGAQGAMTLNTRLLPTIDIAKYLGEVVEVKLPVESPQEDSSLRTRPLYGLLRSVEFSIILKTDGLLANGKVTLDAVRTASEQSAFCMKSELFTDAAK